MDTTGFLEVQPVDLVKRCISEEICRKFGYGTATDHNGKVVQIAQYRDEHGRVVAQKVRTANKKFSIIGAAKEMGLFGQHLWKPGGRRCVVTEGELDCLSIAAATGGSWPVTSLPNGASSAKKAILKALSWLETFELVVLAFDMDDAGRAAAAECVELFSPGKVAVAELPRKDANEMLVAGEVKELSQLLWQARVYRPDGILSLSDIEQRVMAETEMGYPWWVEGLNKVTYGRRPGELIGIGAGTGVGKTDFLSQQIAFDIQEGLKVGVVYLEQDVGETGKRIAGKLAGKTFHIPGSEWTADDLNSAWGKLRDTDRCVFYDNFGVLAFDVIEPKIRYMATALGCHVVYLDHLTALAAAETNEREALDKIMAALASLAKALRIVLIFVSHLATPEGKPHEEGGRVTIRHFRGSRSIGYWSHFLLGLERDSQAPGSPTTLRVLKDRFTGQANGFTTGLQYDPNTGLQSECELSSEGDHEFKDETKGDGGDELPF